VETTVHLRNDIELNKTFLGWRPNHVVEWLLKQPFEKHVCSRHYFCDNEKKDGCLNIGLMAIQPPKAAASQTMVY
jgi:hypothetical protein